MWEATASIVVIATALLILKFGCERRVQATNLLCAALLLTMLFAAPVRQTSVRKRDVAPASSVEETYDAGMVDQNRGFVCLFGARLAQRRENFIAHYKDYGSNLDGEVAFRTTSDIVRYLPRAAAVGLFAPFPAMWFDQGDRLGRSGRLLGGLETLMFYFFAILAVVCIWHERKNPSAWLLLLISVVNCVALGLVVTNVGALFRLRYVFWMLVIILGAEGLRMVQRRAVTKEPLNRFTN